MAHSYDTIFVILSVIVAMLASFTALDLAGRIRSDSGATRLGWIAGGGTVMGLGIWSMHFIGMLAFHLPVPIWYDVPLMLLSVVVAIAASLLALMLINRPRLGVSTLVPGGGLMGVAIAGMHYIGMASVRADARLTYVGSIVALSVLIAIIASLAALWLAFRFRSDITTKGVLLKVLSAVIMGIAISGMHYTAMAAARFAPGRPFTRSVHYILASRELGGAVIASAILIIVLALIGFAIDRNMQARSAFTRRLAEQSIQLGRSEQQYRLLFDHNPNPMCVYVRSTLAFLAVNEATVLCYGYSREEFLSMTLNDIRCEPDTSSNERINLSSEIGIPGASWYGRHRKKDGTLIDVAVTSREIVFDGREAGLALALDVTDRKRAEEALRQSEQRYRELFENIPVGLYRSTPEGRLIDANAAMVSTLGYPDRESLLATPATAFYVDPAERLRWSAEMARAGVVRDFEVRMRRGDGTMIWTRETTRAKRGSDGTVALYEGIIEDITDRVEAEDQLRQTSKMEAVGQLAGGVAHDFNNLLTAIMINGAMLLDRIDPSDPNREEVQEIIAASDRAAGLTRQLLAFSRKQVMQLRVISINAVISNVESMLRRLIGEDIELHISLNPDVARINADPGQLEQVLMNLVVNACGAMLAGGRVGISTSNYELTAESVAGALRVPGGHYVMLAVSDTGMGMTREVQQRIFDPFFTTKEQGRGTGLGLATVYWIVKQSGGEIYVYSEVGKGTTFKIYFPRSTMSGEELRDDAKAGKVPRGSETVLVVEDDSTLRDLTARVLKICGYEVLVAGEALEALAIASDSHTLIDVVITDVVMPGMNGRELVEKLLESRPGMASLLMSGYTDDDVLRRGVLQGDTAFLQKPFSPEQLGRKVRAVLDRVKQ